MNRLRPTVSILLDSLLICVSYEVMKHRYNTVPCIISMDEATTDADANFRFCEDIAITGIAYDIDYVLNFSWVAKWLEIGKLMYRLARKRTYSQQMAEIRMRRERPAPTIDL